MVLTIAVPIGKIIRISNNIGSGNWEHFQFGWGDSYYDYDWGNKEYSWWAHTDEDLVMREEGLYTAEGDPVDVPGLNKKSRRRRIMDNDLSLPAPPPVPGSSTYRYDQSQKKSDSLKILKNKEVQKLTDSIEKVKELFDKKIEKADDRTIHDQNAFIRYDRNEFDFVLGI